MKHPFLLLVFLVLAAVLMTPAYVQHSASAETAVAAAVLPAAESPLSSSEVAPPAIQSANAPESLHDSYVYFDSAVGGAACFLTGATQTFCFSAVSYTTDWEYVYYLWQRFPSDWTITNVYVQGTPYCVNGGTWGSFSWWGPSAREVRITHPRYHHNPSDTCQAYYCFEVTSGSKTPGSIYALESWYWSGTDDGAAPYHPCSSDGYTPSGQPACDEAIWSPAVIPPCPNLYLPMLRK
jgi:hypothetical protein